MGEIPTSSPTLLSVVRQWPVASNIAETLPAGSLLNLARSSSSLREALHGFGSLAENEPGKNAPLDCMVQNVGSRKELHVGNHCTPYWEGLKRIAPFTCSSKTHTKGDKTRSCLYCSMPICESCVIKHSFGKTEHTFKNRCRFMCRQCWDRGNPQRERRYTGRWGGRPKYPHKSASEARECCTCTSKDGWVCNDCKDKQNAVANADGPRVCFGEDCEMILEDDKDRRKICLWCDKPVPRGRASMESRIAFDQKMMDAREREITSQLADFQEYESNRRRHMRMSRREMRGDEAVRDDLDADVPQFLRNLEVFNYQRFHAHPPTGDEIYGSKHGQWRYNKDFLMCFMEVCLKHRDATLLQSVTSSGSSDAFQVDTNAQRRWKEQAELGRLAETHEEPSYSSLRLTLDGIKDLLLTGEEENLTTDADLDLSQRSLVTGEAHLEDSEEEGDGDKLEGHDDIDDHDDPDDHDDNNDNEMMPRQDGEISEAQKETKSQPQSDHSNSGGGLAENQPREEPPEYGADTLILET